MTRHEQLLEDLIKALILDPKEFEGNRIAMRVRETWLTRIKAIFPQLCHKLGKKCDEIFLDYLRTYPPRSWNLQSFGSELPMFLKEVAQTKKMDRYLPEVADFEWSLHWVDTAPLEAVSGATLTYGLHPFVRYLKFKYGIYEWWKTKKDKPVLNTELIAISKNLRGEVEVFEPSMLEAAIIDNLGEMSLGFDQLVSSMTATLPGSQQLQVEVALNSLMEKGVVRGPAVGGG